MGGAGWQKQVLNPVRFFGALFEFCLGRGPAAAAGGLPNQRSGFVAVDGSGRLIGGGGWEKQVLDSVCFFGGLFEFCLGQGPAAASGG